MSCKVVVTGATRGLGRGIARAFASCGAMVGVTGRDTAALAIGEPPRVRAQGRSIPTLLRTRPG